MRTVLLILACAALGAGPLRAAGGTYTITGQIRTPTGASAAANNAAVKYIKVIVRDDELLFDRTLATTHADGAGNFSVTFADAEDVDLYIDLEYTGTAIDGRFVRVRPDTLLGGTFTDSSIQGAVMNNLAAGTHALGVIRTTRTAANILSHVGDALRFVKAQVPTFVMPDDLIARARTTNGASFVEGDGSAMSVAMEDYDGPGAGAAAFSDLHHETGHWIAYRAYGNRRIDNLCNISPHGSSSESCEGFAMQEGGAQYFGVSSAAAIGLTDQKTGIPSAIDWRGDDGTGFNNGGEIVEGALERVWRLNMDVRDQVRTMYADQTDTMREFKVAYATRKGATSAALLTFLNNGADNGIVYTRGKIEGFVEMGPPNAVPSPPQMGNFKVVDDIAFVRGKIKPDIKASTKAELRLAAASALDAPDMKDLGHRLAVNGLGSDVLPPLFTFIGAVAFGSDLTFDTTALPDSDRDLVARTRNAHTWQDTLTPRFSPFGANAGDATANVASDERWLKLLRTLFSQEVVPPTGDDKGKVIIDNTAPMVTNMKP